MKQLLLLGGGHAHVHVLKTWPDTPLADVRVTLVSPFQRQLYSGMVPGLVAGHYGVDDCVIPLEPLTHAARASFIESSATHLDSAARRVTLANGQVLPYDVLSIDTGPVMDRDAIVGAREFGLFVRPIEHFTRLWEELLALAEQRELSIALIGGGAAGVELAMAMKFRLGSRARLSLVTGGGAPLAGYPEPVRAHVRNALRRLGITVLEEACAQISEQHVHLAQGARLQCDAPILAIGSSAPQWLAGSGLALDEQGFIATGMTLQSSSHPEVFAAGDVASNQALKHPRSGVFAVRAGAPLALNLRRALDGGVLVQHAPKLSSLNLLACGGRTAVASWGDWSAQGSWVWFWKNFIDRRFIAKYR